MEKTTQAKFRATFVDIGEGRSGDYDPDDPEDEALLRIDIETLVDGDWTELRDGSYCTLVPVDTPKEEQTRLLDVAAKVLERAEANGESLKRTAEGLSWIEPGDKEEDFGA